MNRRIKAEREVIDVRAGLLKGDGHAFASFPRNETGASADKRVRKLERVVLNALAKEMRLAPLL